MKKMNRFLGLGLLSCATMGCTALSGQPKTPFDQTKQIASLSADFDKAVTDKCESDKDQACRDRIITNQIRAINLVFKQFEDSITAQSGGVSIGGDVIAAALSGAVTVTGGTHAKNLLAALSSFTSATKSSIEKNLFFEKASRVLIGRMQALRQKALAPILEGMTHGIDQYPLSTALLQIDDYIAAESLDRAVNDIEANTNQKSEQAAQENGDIIKRSYGADQGTTLLRKADPKLVRQWMDSHDLKDERVPNFLNFPEYADARKKAVADLEKKNNS